MADLPSANVRIDDEAGAFAGGTGYVVILGCAEKNGDCTPRVFASTKDLLTKHGYSPAVDYFAMHVDETKKPAIFVGLPQAKEGTLSSVVKSGTGTSTVTVTAGTNGVLETLHGVITVLRGGTVGTHSIEVGLSLDGGVTVRRVRLGTANKYVLPYVGVEVNFGEGNLAVGDSFVFRTTAPMWDDEGLAAARLALAAQQKQARSWLLVGDLQTNGDADDVVTQVNAYETSHDRFVYVRTQARDRYLPSSMKGAPSLTFATGPDKVTRGAGSWITDGFHKGMTIVVSGTTKNDGDYLVTDVTASVLSVSGDPFEAEVAAAAAVICSESLTDWRTSIDAEFEDIDGERRIDIGAGYGRKRSPITSWKFRRPVSWAASLREYQHDVQIPTWRKTDGACSGWDLEDENGNLAEHDERINGGLLAGRFTCFRTYSNGPLGTFIAMSLTRATEGSLLSRTHNLAVANIACAVTQAETENTIGQVLQLNDDGTATEASLVVLEERVNSALGMELLAKKAEGARASGASWKVERTAVLNVPGATLNGVLDLLLNGTLEKINTRVRVLTAG